MEVTIRIIPECPKVNVIIIFFFLKLEVVFMTGLPTFIAYWNQVVLFRAKCQDTFLDGCKRH